MWSTVFDSATASSSDREVSFHRVREEPLLGDQAEIDGSRPLTPRTDDAPVARILLEDEEVVQNNYASSVVLLSKAIVGGGIAALPLTFNLLGWPLASSFLLLSAYVTWASISIITRVCAREGLMSYSGVVQKLYGRAAYLLLEVAVLAFTFGMMLVYLVATGDLLVGNGAFRGLLCRWCGKRPGFGWACSRPIVTGAITLFLMTPLVSFRRMHSMTLVSSIGMGAVAAWGLCTCLLVAAAGAQDRLYGLYLLPDMDILGPGSLRILTNICACFCLLTTANFCQLQSVFIAAELRPFSVTGMEWVAAVGISFCTLLYLSVSLGTAALFGDSLQPDVLHNYQIEAMSPLIGDVGGIIVYTITRLAFLSAVIALFPLTVSSLIVPPPPKLLHRFILQAAPAFSRFPCQPWKQLNFFSRTSDLMRIISFFGTCACNSAALPNKQDFFAARLTCSLVHPSCWPHLSQSVGQLRLARL
eukprot:jgi/Botrbrau1/16529/Bobra.314_1s0002.2